MFSFLFSLLAYNAEAAKPKRARATADPSWLMCQEQNCLQQQQQQQQHFMMQQQHHWLRQNWQQQQLNSGCPLPLPAPPAPVSARMGPTGPQNHPTGFYMHHGAQYHQWHPAYFCPPSAVQMRQQQWLQQQQFQQQQHMVNNNLPPMLPPYKSGPCCPKCFEGKCNQQSVINFNPPAPPVPPVQVSQNTTSVRYRSV